MTKVIYKVRMLDFLGKEIAEFGFYEDNLDADRRRAEVASMTMMSGGTLDIIKIELQLATNLRLQEEENIQNYYNFK
jgi:hypothetical protein